MKKTKAFIAASMALLIAFVGAGCSKKEAVKVHNENLSGVNEFPLVKEKEELTMFIAKPTMIADINTNEFTKWYEEKTNVHINWDIASGDTVQAINLKIAGGDLPDVFFNVGFSPLQVFNYGEQGLFIDLKDYIEEESYYLKDILNKREDIKRKITTDGAIYGLPIVSESMSALTINKMWIYKDWLDKLGLEEPKTTDDFYEMLKAFKEKDPNGNGKADEIPLVARGGSGNFGIENFIMNAFIYNDSESNRLYVEDGVVKCSGITEEYREGLRYIKRLYDEELLIRDVFTIDRTRITALGENEEIPIVGAGTGLWAGMFTLSTGDRIRDYVAIAPLEGPTGLRQTPLTNADIGLGTSFVVTKDCKNPALAVKWVDYMYSNEGRIRMGGIKGYREAKEGEIGLNGKQAKYTYDPVPEEEQNTAFGAVQNEFWGANFGIYYIDREIHESQKLLDNDLSKLQWEASRDKYWDYVVDKSYPVLPIEIEKASEYLDLETTVREAMNNGLVAFVKGDLDLDKDWDKYLKDLDKYGLSRLLEMAQERYDKYYNK